MQGEVHAGEWEEVIDQGEPGGLQEQGEEHILEEEGMQCPIEAPVPAESESICLQFNKKIYKKHFGSG